MQNLVSYRNRSVSTVTFLPVLVAGFKPPTLRLWVERPATVPASLPLSVDDPGIRIRNSGQEPRTDESIDRKCPDPVHRK